MSSSPSAVSQARPVSLMEAIRQGGPLAQWFHEAAEGQRAAIQSLLEGRRTGELIAALRDEGLRRVTAGASRSPLQVLHECAAGCNACCRTVAVDVTPLEALAASDFLRANYDEPHLAATTERLRHNAAARAGMTPQALRQVRQTCALLTDEGKCGVYPVRPLACAGAFSTSRRACELAAEPSATAAAAPVPIDPYAKSWTLGVSGGLQRALIEAGLDGNLYELNSILLRALETPDAARRWLRREDIFRGCICTDAHSPPRVARPPRRAVRR